jgi:fatty-acyl-CoA synthase
MIIPPSVSTSALSYPDLLAQQAGLQPGALAALAADDSITFAGLLARSSHLAGALHRANVRRGQRVGLLIGNRIEWLAIALGVMMAGATAVPLSTWSTRDELEFLLTDAAIDLLFVDAAFQGRDFVGDVAAISARGTFGKPVVQLDGEPSLQAMPLSEFLDGVGPLRSVPEDIADEDALILYTSGSTSKPKGVRLTHRLAVRNGFQIGRRQGLRAGDRVFLSAPLFWSYGAANALPAAFGHGAALVLMERFEPVAALHLIEHRACTAIYTLPAMTNAMVRSAGFSRRQTRTLRTGLTIGTSEDFMNAHDNLGVPDLCNIYGATETCGNCTVTPHDWPLEHRRICQGPPLDGQLLRLRDPETQEIVPQGGVGLVEVSGQISPGYTGASAALNSSAFTEDGYYRTGDLGRMNEFGAFVFVGRETEMIKRQGINVSPAEIEEVMKKHAGVSDCAVVGIPDADKGELIFAGIVPAGDWHDVQDLDRFCRVHLSKYKIPDVYDLWEALPLTPTGKLQRKEVKALAQRTLASRRGVTA